MQGRQWSLLRAVGEGVKKNVSRVPKKGPVSRKDILNSGPCKHPFRFLILYRAGCWGMVVAPGQSTGTWGEVQLQWGKKNKYIAFGVKGAESHTEDGFRKAEGS